jgi:hypothetical protein
LISLAHKTGAQEKPSIVIQSVKPPATGASFVEAYGLTRDDLHWIKQLPGLRGVIPVREQPEDAKAGEHVKEVRLVGTVPEYAKAHGVKTIRGRFLTTKDEDARENVAVISDAVAREVLRSKKPLGRHIRLSGDYFTVVGVVEDRRDTPGEVFIPLATMQAALGDTFVRLTVEASVREQFELSGIELWLEDRRRADQTAAAVRRILKKLHHRVDYSVVTE